MRAIHGQFTNTLILYTTALVLWSFYLYFRKQSFSASYFGALAINAILFAVQFAFGVALLIQGGAAAVRGVHFLYGATGLLTIPALYLLTRGRTSPGEALVYGLTLLFLIGVVLRASASAAPI